MAHIMRCFKCFKVLVPETIMNTVTLEILPCLCIFHEDCNKYFDHEYERRCRYCHGLYTYNQIKKLTFPPQQVRIDTENSIEINLLKSQLEQSTTNTIDLQERLNNCEKTVKNLEEENAQLVLSARNEVTTLKQQLNERDKTIDCLKELEGEPEQGKKESMELKKKLAESDQIIVRLRENAQLKINSRYNCELEKPQISSNKRSSKHLSIYGQLEQSFDNERTEQELHENIVKMLKLMKEGSAQLEQISKITNELQAQRYESNQKFEFLKTVNAQLEKHLNESDKTVEFLRQANIQIELQERLGRLEKIIMEQQQEINEAKKYKRDLVREQCILCQANISNSATLADEMKNQPPNNADNDNQ